MTSVFYFYISLVISLISTQKHLRIYSWSESVTCIGNICKSCHDCFYCADTISRQVCAIVCVVTVNIFCFYFCSQYHFVFYFVYIRYWYLTTSSLDLMIFPSHIVSSYNIWSPKTYFTIQWTIILGYILIVAP